MSLLVTIGIGLGGAVGALLRALFGRLIRSDFPVATLLVNILGSFILALAYTAMTGTSELQRAIIGTGFCGAFTTFSTFILETVILARSGRVGYASLYLILTLTLCSLASLSGFCLMG